MKNKKGSFSVEGIIVISWSLVLIVILFVSFLQLFMTFFSLTDNSMKLKAGISESDIAVTKKLLFDENKISVGKEKERKIYCKDIRYLDVFNYYFIFEEVGGTINEIIENIEK